MLQQLGDKEALATLLHMGLFEDEWHCLEWRGLYVVLFVTTEGLSLRSLSKSLKKLFKLQILIL